jgi:hypothetical protein
MSETHLLRRIIRVIVAAAVLELGLVALGHYAPAFSHLSTLGMYIVAAGTLYAVWHAAKKRSGEDRRNGERREEESDEVTPAEPATTHLGRDRLGKGITD